MKKLLSITLALLIILAVSCSKDTPENTQPHDPENKPIKGSITLQVHVDGLPSKVEFSIGNGSGYNWPHGISYITFPPIRIGSTNRDNNIENKTPQDIEINWGDGSVTHMTSHTYEKRGTHTITITGTGIKIFNCSYNNVTSLDISKCPNLEALILNPKINSLNITKNPQLISLSWQPDDQATLNVSRCPKLEHLSIGSNVQRLDISNSSMLQRLEYSGSYTDIDLSNVPFLTYLKVNGQFSVIDLEKCPELKYLQCGSPSLTTLKIDNCKKLRYIRLAKSKIETLELNGYTQLSWFESPESNLKKLTIKNSFNNYNESTNYINCSGGFIHEYERSEITELEIVNCPALRSIEAYHGKLVSVKIENCESLDRINVAGNQLSAINIIGCEYFTSLNIAVNLFNNAGLNYIYNILPAYKINPSPLEPHPRIYITQNNGTGDTSIATSKGWEIVNQ